MADKKINLKELKADAASARAEMLARGGPVAIWQLPPEFLKRGELPFTHPADLWEVATHYFQWCEDNPISYQTELGRNSGNMVTVKKPRPYHILAFRAFAGISSYVWQKLNGIPDFCDVIEMVEHIIYTQKFDHAMVGVFDSSLTAKDLGLSDRREISGPGGSAISVDSTISPKDILLAKLGAEEKRDA